MSPIRLSPLVWLYEAGSPAPELRAGEIGLATIPSSAFGDGSHPTTRICAGAVDFWCRKHLGVRVLDVGTGSGVLARIARARGASMVVGTDIDTGALFAARANAQLDSGAGIIFSDLEPDHWGATFDLVVANILAEPLQMLKFSLLSALAPGGTLILSGFTRLQIPGIRAAFEHIGLIFAQESLLGEWAMLMFKRNRNPASSPPLHYARDSGA